MENNNNIFTNTTNIENEAPKVTILPEQDINPNQQQLPNTNYAEQKTQLVQNDPNQENIILLNSQKISEELMKDHLTIPEQTIKQQSLSSLPNIEKNDVYSQNNIQNSNYKTIAIILGITLVIVLLAFPLYIGLNNHLNSKQEDTKQDVETKAETQEQDPQTLEPTPSPTPVEPSTPPINFDLDLSFEKGYSTNPNEYHQTTAFTPESKEGVVKCETIKTISSAGVKANAILYFYYKDSLTKKLLTVEDGIYSNQQTYSTYVNSYQNFRAIMQKNQHLYTKLEVDNKTYRIRFSMLADLAYSQTTSIPNSNQYYAIKISYNTSIKNAMNKILTDPSYNGNMYCSSLVTTDASI